ncbi:hypothetical protein pb186bvf_017648 [Paramecium bursaria]
MRKGPQQIIRPFSPNLTFKTDQMENVLQPCQEKSENQYLRFELQQEKLKTQNLEAQLQYELQQKANNEQLLMFDMNQLKQQNEEFKMRCQELEIKVRENTLMNQDNLREATSRIALLSIEVERLNQLSQKRYQENEVLRQYQDIKVIEDMKQDLQSKQKTIFLLQDQLQGNYKSELDQLVTELNTLNQILEDKEGQITLLSQQLEQAYNEISSMNNFNRQLNDENRQLKQQQDNCYKEVDRLNKIIIQRNQELQDMYSKSTNNNEQIKLMQQELQRVSYQDSANQDWKRNFLELNERYHKTQEQLCLLQAELEATKAFQQTSKRQY